MKLIERAQSGRLEPDTLSQILSVASLAAGQDCRSQLLMQLIMMIQQQLTASTVMRPPHCATSTSSTGQAVMRRPHCDMTALGSRGDGNQGSASELNGDVERRKTDKENEMDKLLAWKSRIENASATTDERLRKVVEPSQPRHSVIPDPASPDTPIHNSHLPTEQHDIDSVSSCAVSDTVPTVADTVPSVTGTMLSVSCRNVSKQMTSHVSADNTRPPVPTPILSPVPTPASPQMTSHVSTDKTRPPVPTPILSPVPTPASPQMTSHVSADNTRPPVPTHVLSPASPQMQDFPPMPTPPKPPANLLMNDGRGLRSELYVASVPPCPSSINSASTPRVSTAATVCPSAATAVSVATSQSTDQLLPKVASVTGGGRHNDSSELFAPPVPRPLTVHSASTPRLFTTAVCPSTTTHSTLTAVRSSDPVWSKDSMVSGGRYDSYRPVTADSHMPPKTFSHVASSHTSHVTTSTMSQLKSLPEGHSQLPFGPQERYTHLKTTTRLQSPSAWLSRLASPSAFMSESNVPQLHGRASAAAMYDSHSIADELGPLPLVHHTHGPLLNQQRSPADTADSHLHCLPDNERQLQLTADDQLFVSTESSAVSQEPLYTGIDEVMKPASTCTDRVLMRMAGMLSAVDTRDDAVTEPTNAAEESDERVDDGRTRCLPAVTSQQQQQHGAVMNDDDDLEEGEIVDDCSPTSSQHDLPQATKQLLYLLKTDPVRKSNTPQWLPSPHSPPPTTTAATDGHRDDRRQDFYKYRPTSSSNRRRW